MSARRVDPERFPIWPEGLVGWDRLVHAGFGSPLAEAVPAFTWCGALVDELPPERVAAEEMPDRLSCTRCETSVRLAARLVDGVEQDATQRSDLFGVALAYGAAMAAVLAADVEGGGG